MLHLQQGLMSATQSDPLHHLIRTEPGVSRFNSLELGVFAPPITRGYSSFSDPSPNPRAPRSSRWHSDSTVSSAIELSVMSSVDEESDASSPPLWKTTTTTTTLPLPPLTTASSQAIVAAGRQELMEILRNVPESEYELSLKDIVDLDAAAAVAEGGGAHADALVREKSKKRADQNSNGSSWSRSRGNRDFLLNVFLPASLGPKKSSSCKVQCPKFPPKPQKMDVEKNADKDWWKKRFSSCRKSASSNTSRSSSDSKDTADSRRYTVGCCSYFTSKGQEESNIYMS